MKEKQREERAQKEWRKPTIEDLPVTMEVAAYRNAELPEERPGK